MSKKYDKKKLNDENVLEFQTDLYRLDEKKSQAWLSLPFPAVRKMKLKKDSLLDVNIKESEEQ